MRRVALGLLFVFGVACAAQDAATAGRAPGYGSDVSPSEGAGPGGEGQTGQPGNNPGSGGGFVPGDFLECGADTFTAGLKRAANIVWVIDTSGSMNQEAALVQDNMNRFVTSIVGAGLEEYRVVVVSKPSFVSVPNPLGTDREHFLFVDEKVGSNEPLEDLLSRFDDYRGFLLPGAVTHFVVVTDDESDIKGSAFVTQMGQRLSGAEFRVHAIASPPDASGGGNFWEDLFGGGGGCSGLLGNAAAPGAEHYAAAELTGGLTFSICEADWSGLFSELATEVGETATIPCDVPIPAGDGGQAVNPNLVNVLLGFGDAPTSADVLPQVSSKVCTNGGWSYDNDAAPTRIVLCPASCEKARNNAVLQIAVGCETLVQ